MHQAAGGTNFGPVYTHKDFERVKNSRSEEGWKEYAIKRGYNDTRLNHEIIMDYGADSRLVTETFSNSSKPIEQAMQKLQVSDSQSEAVRQESTLRRYPTLTVKRINCNPRGEETRPPSHYASGSECGDSVAAQATSGPPKQQGLTFALSAPFPNDPYRSIKRKVTTFGQAIRSSSSFLRSPGVTTQDKPPSIIAASSTQSRIKDFQPFFDRVVVERLAAEPKGENMPPEKTQCKVLEASVVAIGPGCRTEEGNTVPMQVKVGDRVLVPDCDGSKVMIDEKEYYIIRESDIIGKFAHGHT